MYFHRLKGKANKNTYINKYQYQKILISKHQYLISVLSRILNIVHSLDVDVIEQNK
jgi:hypothetical protein